MRGTLISNLFKPKRIMANRDLYHEDFYLKPKYIKLERYSRVLAYHPLPEQDIETVVEEWKKQEEDRKRQRLPLYRKSFITYHINMWNERKSIQALKQGVKCKDIGEAKQWLAIMTKFPLDFRQANKRIEEMRLFEKERSVILEVLEWIYCTERLAYIHLANDQYNIQELRRTKKTSDILAKCKKRIVNAELLTTRIAKSNSFKCSQLRLFFEQKESLLFDPNDIINLKEKTARDVPKVFQAKILEFETKLQKKFLQDLPKKETRKKMFDITLIQETTKLAFHTIRNYIRFLQKEHSIIQIDSNLVGKRLFFPIEQLKEYFKEPILLISAIEWVRFSTTDVDYWTTLVSQIIMDQLNQEKILSIPILYQFQFFIQDQKIPDSSSPDELLSLIRNFEVLKLRLTRAPETILHHLFTIKLRKVWQAIEQRLLITYNLLTDKLRINLAEQIDALQSDFRKDVKVLSFRSINPAQMLANKATVDEMLETDMPSHGKSLSDIYERLLIFTQHVKLDSLQESALIRLATVCRSLPKLIEHHQHFFNRRLGTFQLFVNKKQKAIQVSAQKLNERLKVLQTMAIPQDSQTYLEDLAELKPSVQNLLADLEELNRFEKVVKIVLTDLPRHRQSYENMLVMEKLLESTLNYFEIVNDFFESHRTAVNIPALLDFVTTLLKDLSEYESGLSGQRAARLFIVQMRNDIDAFKKNFAVMEIMCCPRLLDNHWKKMSEVMSFDMAVYANSTVSVLCELGLDKYLSQLKPIVFAAEREAKIIDHLDDVISYWTTALFELEETNYWKLKQPTNLRNQLNAAIRDVEILHDIRDTNATPPHISKNLNKWTSIVEQLRSTLGKWYVAWEEWHTVARLFERSRYELEEQFLQFRQCAKFWKKLVESFVSDSSVLLILDLKHIKCWLRTISHMMSSITLNLAYVMNKIRSNYSRLTLISDYHLLALLSAETPVETISYHIHLIFPNLRKLFFNNDELLELHDHNGDRMILERITKAQCRRMTCPDLIEKIEKAFCEKITEILSSDQRGEYSKQSNKMLNQLYNEMLKIKKIPDEINLSFTDGEFILENLSHQQHTKIIIEFIYLNIEHIYLPKKMCQLWSEGQFMLLIGPIALTRKILNKVISKLFVSCFFVNCHEDLIDELYNRVVETSFKESILIVFENINQLSSSGLYNLFTTIRKKAGKVAFPRLFFTSTESISTVHMPMCISPYQISNEILPAEEEKIEISLYNEIEEEHADLEVSTIPSIKPLCPVGHLAEQLKNGTVTACVGPLAKSFLRRSQSFLPQKIEWFYIDSLTKKQSMRSSSGFGCQYEGALLDIFQEFEAFSSNDNFDIKEDVNKITIFYGFSNIWQMIPILSSLFLRYDGNVIPKPYMTLPDGSMQTCPKSVHCVLCIPDSDKTKLEILQTLGIPYETFNKDLMNSISEIYEKSWKTCFHNILNNSKSIEVFEIIIKKVVTSISLSKPIADVIMLLLHQEFCEISPNGYEAVFVSSITLINNFLALYSDLPTELDLSMHKRISTAFTKTIMKLPQNLSEWKLSTTDFSKLVKWHEQPYHRSSLEKEDRLSDLVVVWPVLDRMLHFGIRLLSLGKNLIISGAQYSQKSTFVKMLGKQLENEPNVSISFQWLGNESRVCLESIQKMFARIVEDVKTNETKYIVVDKFSVAESLLAVLELFVDCGAYYQNGKKVVTDKQLKFILITDDEDWMSLEDNHALWETFSNLPMKTLTFDELQFLVYQLTNWNLNLKSFSSEYQSLLEPIAYATVFLATRQYVAFSVLSVCMRIVKGLQFAFPDNSPDPSSFIRLWVHECLRVIMDALDEDQVPLLLQDIRFALKKNFDKTVEELLKDLTIWSDEDDDLYLEKTNQTVKSNTIQLENLLYSEMDVTESYDGLSYVPVKCMMNFNTIMENFLFEYHRNHRRDRIQLAIDSDISSYVQQISRIIRQAGEHLCLSGQPGQGRSQMVTLAAAANCAQLLRFYPDVRTFETFINGLYDVFGRAILSTLNSNQHVCVLIHMDFDYARVEPRWMDYLRLWLERPETNRVISDEQLIACGEQLIENEKSLAAQMQSVGIRLPGQRSCRFLAIEVLKEPTTLRRIMELRIHDLIHVMFLVDQHVKTDFSWCSVIHVKTASESKYTTVSKKILQDAKLDNILNVNIIQKLFKIGIENLQTHRTWNQKNITDFNVYYHLTYQIAQLWSRKHQEYTKRKNSVSAALSTLAHVRELKVSAEKVDENVLLERISMRETELSNLENDINIKSDTLEQLLKKTEEAETMLQLKRSIVTTIEQLLEQQLTEPENQFQKALKSLAIYSCNDYRTFSQLSKPSIGCRYVAEVLQILVGSEFKRKNNKSENWVQMQKMLRTPLLFTRVLKFDVDSLSSENLDKVQQYVDSRDFRPVKMRTECELAAELSIWINALVKLSRKLHNLSEKRKELAEANQIIKDVQIKNNESKAFIRSLQEDLTLLSEKRKQNEFDLSADTKLVAYRTRSGILLDNLKFLEKKWTEDCLKYSNIEQDLVGQCCLQAAYTNFASNLSKISKQQLLENWLKYLKEENLIKHHEPTCSVLAMEIVRDIEHHRQFTFFIDEKDILLNILLKLHPQCVTIDVDGLDWMEADLCERIIRHLSNSTPIVRTLTECSAQEHIFYNIHHVPPVEYYSLLSKWEEKEIRFHNSLYTHKDDVLMIFITNKQLDLSPQFNRIIYTYTLNETIRITEEYNEVISEKVLDILEQKTASEILESEEISKDINHILNSFDSFP